MIAALVTFCYNTRELFHVIDIHEHPSPLFRFQAQLCRLSFQSDGLCLHLRLRFAQFHCRISAGRVF